jgi:predicted MFS family arabinose efflux permease
MERLPTLPAMSSVSSFRARLALPTALMMFPQVVETMYSPALPSIAQGYAVTSARAGQTLSLYFAAFALGTMLWGRLCDRWGRRPAMLAGLALYGMASCMALWAPDFGWLLAARILAAIGAAVGSVVTQTVLRDQYGGAELARVFALMGLALAISPALGLLAGSALVRWRQHEGVFLGLAWLALLLGSWTAWSLPETRPKVRESPAPVWPVLGRMVRDAALWRTAGNVAWYNLCLYGFYQLMPFHLAQWGAPSSWLATGGVLLGLGALAGAWLTRRWLAQGLDATVLIRRANVLLLTAALGVMLAVLGRSAWLVVPMAVVALAYGLAIPNLLAPALQHYADCRGTAAALLGLAYYTLLGVGLALAALVQQLGVVCLASALAVHWLQPRRKDPSRGSH